MNWLRRSVSGCNSSVLVEFQQALADLVANPDFCRGPATIPPNFTKDTISRR